MLKIEPRVDLTIPRHLKDIDQDWAFHLVCKINHLEEEIQAWKVVTLSIHPQLDFEEGVLSDTCKIFIHLEKPSEQKRKPLVHNLFVKIIPNHFRNLIATHRLFEREITFYSELVPKIQDLVRAKGLSWSSFKYFSVPKFLFGRVNDQGSDGVIVLEDVSARLGFKTFDTTLQMLDLEHLKVAVGGLAEFHALVLATDMHSEQKLEHSFPIFNSGNLMWMQNDMVKLLESMVQVATNFLKSLPGGEEIARRYASALRDPQELLKNSMEKSGTFRCLLHGDSWHNNFMFSKGRKGLKLNIVDWQVSYIGNPMNDLCYLIYSSTYSLFRRKHLETLLKFYHDTLMTSLRGLRIDNFCFTLDQLRQEFQKSLWICLLYCANGDDLICKETSAASTVSDDLNNNNTVCKPSLATDKDIKELDAKLSDGRVGLVVDKHFARLVRRKNFVDICREAMRNGVI